jgi:hypothetical protein
MKIKSRIYRKDIKRDLYKLIFHEKMKKRRCERANAQVLRIMCRRKGEINTIRVRWLGGGVKNGMKY